MKEQVPVVSVLMPVYNGMPHLPLAVNSILAQTFRDFEFIIVDDASTDESAAYLKSLTDDRLVIVHLPENKGVTGALQEGMKRVRGAYVARLDSDDVAMAERLRLQVDYMQSHPEIGLLGSSYDVIDESNKITSSRTKELTDMEIRWRLLFKNPFFHSSVLFRKEVLDQHQLGYSLRHGEDYDLWTKMMKHTRGFISGDSLIQYRVSQKSWTFTKGTEQTEASTTIALRQMKDYLSQDEWDLKNLMAWVRGATGLQQMKLLYILLALRFIQHHHREITSGFVLDRLTQLKGRVGIGGLLRCDVFPLYRLYFKIMLK